MAILGNDSDHSSNIAGATNRKIAWRFTLASAGVLNELHAWVDPRTLGASFLIHIHADSAGAPGTRLAYTSTFALAANSGEQEISQSGFAVSLAAADYWLGITISSSNGQGRVAASGSTGRAIQDGGTFSPPPDPFGTPTSTSATANPGAVWAVVGAPAASFVPQIVML